MVIGHHVYFQLSKKWKFFSVMTFNKSKAVDVLHKMEVLFCNKLNPVEILPYLTSMSDMSRVCTCMMLYNDFDSNFDYYAFCNISSYNILAYITKNYIALIYYAKIVHLLCQFHAGKVGFSAVCQAIYSQSTCKGADLICQSIIVV